LIEGIQHSINDDVKQSFIRQSIWFEFWNHAALKTY